jgi:hypothetical protein
MSSEAIWRSAVGRRLAERGEWDDAADVHVIVPGGMGDFHWIWCKLASWATGAPRVRFHVAAGDLRGGRPAARRGAEYARLCGAPAEYDAAVTTDAVWAAPGAPPLRERGIMVVHANRHLESGRGLESWYPELPLRHHYPLRLPAEADAKARTLLRNLPPKPVCLFTGGASYMGGQQPPEEWRRLARAVLATWDETALVIAGAGEDVPHAAAVADAAPPGRRLLAFNLPVPVLVALLRRCRAFVGVAAGPGILGTAFRLPAALFYPPHLRRMPGTWEPPDMLAAGLCPAGLLEEMPRCREMVFPMLQRALRQPRPAAQSRGEADDAGAPARSAAAGGSRGASGRA